jgi:hypothetical protein
MQFGTECRKCYKVDVSVSENWNELLVEGDVFIWSMRVWSFKVAVCMLSFLVGIFQGFLKLGDQ